MKCGHCKSVNVTREHVWACSPASSAPVAPVRTWQENKAVAIAKVLGSSPVVDARPAIVKAATVPDGRYAIDHSNGVVKFYVVNTPTEGKWAGYTFVKVQASDEEWPVRNRQEREAILARIAIDPAAASKLYGTELGRCGVCNRTLTDPESRANGIGPICAAKF